MWVYVCVSDCFERPAETSVGPVVKYIWDRLDRQVMASILAGANWKENITLLLLFSIQSVPLSNPPGTVRVCSVGEPQSELVHTAGHSPSSEVPAGPGSDYRSSLNVIKWLLSFAVLQSSLCRGWLSQSKVSGIAFCVCLARTQWAAACHFHSVNISVKPQNMFI